MSPELLRVAGDPQAVVMPTVAWINRLVAVLSSLEIEGDGAHVVTERGAKRRIRLGHVPLSLGKAKTGASGITAAGSGTTQSWGSGTVTLYKLTLDGSGNPQWELTATTETMYNAFYSSAIGASKDIVYVRGVYGTRGIVLLTNC